MEVDGICTIKLEGKPLAQIKGVQKLHFLKQFCHFQLQKWNQQILMSVTLPNCAKFHPQTTEIKHFETECF